MKTFVLLFFLNKLEIDIELVDFGAEKGFASVTLLVFDVCTGVFSFAVFFLMIVLLEVMALFELLNWALFMGCFEIGCP